MKRVLLALALLFANSALADATSEIAAGRAALIAHDLPTAHSHFTAAVVADPTNQTANALLGLTRLFDITAQTSSGAFLDGLGVVPNLGASGNGRDVYNWNAAMAKDVNGDVQLPTDYNFTTLEAYWQGTLIPESVLARANFAVVTNTNFLMTLTPAETKMPVSLNIDYADILMARACLRAAEFLAHWGSGQNLNVNLEDVHAALKGDMFTIQKMLADNPNFLTAGSASERTAAKAALQDMIATYRLASVALRARPAGVQRLFMLEPADLPMEAEFRQMLDQIEQSLTEPIGIDNQSLFTGPLFDAAWSARAQLPTFSTTGFNVLSVPDASLGGILAGFNKEKLAAALSDPHDTLAEMGWGWVSPTPQGNTLYKFHKLASGKLLAVGNAGTIMTSTDGTTWAVQQIAGVGQINGITENAGKIVVCTYDGSIYTSSDDAVTWQRAYRGAAAGFHSVVYGGGKYVAIGDYGVAATSIDGSAWNESTTSNVSMTSIAYSGGQFVAVGADETTGNAAILTSPDGMTWTSRLNTNLSGAFYWSVAANGSTVVAVGTNNHRAASTDGGNTWSTGTILASPPATFNVNGGFNGVAFSNGLFVAVGVGSTIATSPDGVTWTPAASGETFLTFTGAGASGTSTYVVSGGGVILKSIDNATFSRSMSPAYATAASIGNLNLTALTVMDGKLYTGGGTGVAGGGMILRTSDGLSYTATTVPGTTNNITDFIRKDALNYLAVGNGGVILTSADSGDTWTQIISGDAGSNTTANLTSITYLNGNYIATGNGSRLLISPDGATNNWKTTTFGLGGMQMNGVAFGNGIYVAVGGSNVAGSPFGYVVTTADPFATTPVWTQRLIPTSDTLKGIVFYQGVFTAVGTDGVIIRSEDGINWWRAGDDSIRTNLTSIRVLDGRYYATQQSGSLSGNNFESQAAVLMSSNAEDWVRIPLGTANGPNRVELFSGRLYTSNGGSTILRSASLAALAAPVVTVLTPGAAYTNTAQGHTLTLAVTAVSDGATTYQWKKGGVDISGETGASLTLGNIQNVVDEGTYTVDVTNAAGTTTSSDIVVTVNDNAVAPVITSQPESQTVNVGLNATFYVEATGSTPLTYQWKKDGANVADGNAAGATSSTLTITGLTAANAGSYTVDVTNSVTTVTSSAAVLTVDSNPAYTYTTLAGSPGMFGTSDNTGAAARFDKPYHIAVDSSGNVYVASPQSHTIRKVTPAGVVTTIAGLAYTSGNTDATGTAARFNAPYAVALNPAGTILYVADNGNSKIRMINLADSVVTTLTSAAYTANALAVDSTGNVYYTGFDQTVRKVTSGGTVSIFAGSFNTTGSTNATGTSARFNSPQGIVLDAAGTNLYVADSNNALIRKITVPGAVVTTYAGQPGVYGADDGAALGATFNFPIGVALDSLGNLLVTDTNADVIRKISPAGIVSTIGGQAWWRGFMNGADGETQFSGPVGIAVDSSNNLYIAEQYNQIIRKGVPVTALNAPIIGLSPQSQTVNVGTNVSLTVTASGISAFTYQWKKNGSNLTNTGNVSGADTAMLSLANVQTTDAGSYTVLVTNTEGSALSAPASLNVSVAPVITGQPAAQSVNTGGAINLSVTATGAGDMTYQWRRNGFDIAGANGSTYSIGSATRGNAGVYDVVINGVGGSVTSAPSVVTVAPTAYPGILAVDTSFFGASGSPLLTLSARIFTAIALPDGKWMVGGEFVRWDSAPRTFLARLNADYSLDNTWMPPTTNGFVYALARSPAADGSIYVGGEFTAVDGHLVPGLFRLKSNGALDLSFLPQAGAPNAAVTALAVQADGKPLVARYATLSVHTSVSGTSLLQRLNTDGTLDGTFSVNIVASNRLNAVVAEPGGAIAFAGTFTTVNGTGRTNVARVDATGITTDTVFAGTGANNTVNSLTRFADGTYLLAGNFNQVNVQNRSRAAMLNSDGTLNTTFAPASSLLNGNALGAAKQGDGKVVVVGLFTTAGGSPTDGIVRLSTTGTVDTLYPSSNSTGSSSLSTISGARSMFVFAQGDGSTAIFGGFQAVLNQQRIGLAVITSGGTLAPSPAPLLYRPTYANSAFITGSQTTVFGGIHAAGATGGLSHAARLNDNGTLDGSFPQGTGFNPNGLSQFGIYRTVRQADGKFLVIGDLTGYNGNPAYRLMRINADGTYDGSFNAGGGPGSALTPILPLSGGRTLLFGFASGYTFNGQGATTVLRLNEDGSRDFSLNVGSGINQNSVSAAYEQPDGKLVLSGNFTNYNGTAVPGLMRLNTDGSLDGTFNCGSGIAPSSTVFINFITGLPDGRLVLSGNFTTYNGSPANRVAVISSTGALDGSFTAPAELNAQASQVVVQEDGKLIVLGDFTGTPWPYAVRLTSTGAIDSTFALRGLTHGFGAGSRITLADDGSVYVNGGNPISYNYGIPFAFARFRGTPIAPTVTTQPAAVTANLGSPATLSVRAHGTAPYTYQWRKGGSPLSDGGTIIGANYSALNITSLSAGDAGSYDVIITNSEGNVTSAAATITIGSPAATITTPPAGFTGTIGQAGSLSVTVSGQGPFTYQWQHNGANVGTNSPTLSLPSVSLGDAGVYTVTVTNAQGSVTSAPVTVNVPLAAAAGVEAIDAAFTRPEFRRAALPGRLTADQVSGSGKIYAAFKNGGNISGANNQRIGAVMRLNADGTLDSSFNTGSFLTDAWAIVPMANGQVLVGGLASAENYESGVPLFRVFRFNSDGTRDTAFNSPVFSAMPRYMTLQPDGKLLVAPTGGNSGNGGLTNLVRLNTDGSQDGTFTAPTFNGGATVNAIFTTIVVDPAGKILIGGTFNSVNGTNFPGVARLTSTGSLDGTFVPSGFTRNNGNQIRGLGLQTQGANAGKILVAGGTIMVAGTSRPVIRLDSTGALDNSFTLQTVGAVITAPGQRPRLLNVLPNDKFTVVAEKVTMFNADGSLDGTYTRPNLSLESFWMDTLADGSVLVASEYGTTVNGSAAPAPVKFTPTGAVDGSFTPATFQVEVYPSDFAIRPDGRVLVWGNFDTVNTTARSGMALLNTDGSLDAFNLSGVASLYSIQDAALLGSGQILAGTNLGTYSASGTFTNGVSRFNANGSVDGTFVLDPLANPDGLHPLPDDRLLTWSLDANNLLNGGLVFKRLAVDGAIDGTFTGLGSTAFGAVYRNGDTTIKTVVLGQFEVAGHYPDGRILVIATGPNGSYPDGAATLDFTLLRLNPDGTIDSGFTAPTVAVNTSSGVTSPLVDPLNTGLGAVQHPLLSASAPFSGVVPQADGSVIVYGSFTSLGGNAAPGIARLTSTGSFDTGFTVGSGPALSTPAGRYPLVKNITVGPDGKTWITGLFDSFSGVAAPGIVRLNADGSVDTALTTQIAYRPYLGDGTKVGFGPSGEVYLTGTYAQPFEPFPFGLHRLVGTVTPAIGTHPQSQSVAVGANVTLSVAVTPGLTVAYQWYKDGVAISGATNSTLKLTNVQAGDVASYTVTVTNALGSVTSSAAVLSLPLTPAPGVAAIDPAFTRPEFRRAALPGRLTADQVTGSGKIYAAFKNGNYITGAGNQRIGAVIRLNANGTLDSSFNTGSFLADAWAIVPMANGQVLVGGIASAENTESGAPLYRVFRFNSDGSRDTSYNSPVFSATPRFMTLQPADGKLLVAPSNGSDSGNGGLKDLARLNTDGSLDSSFTIPTLTNANLQVNLIFTTIVVDSNGKILIGGTFDSVNGTARPGVARLNTDGALDTSFVPSGFTRPNNNQIRGLGLQTNGKILVAGGTIQVGGINRPVIRLDSTGALDGTFSLRTVGEVIAAPGVRPRLLNVLPNDKFTVVAEKVTMFNADGTLDSGYTRPAFSLESFWMDTLADGSVLVAPEFGTTVNSSPVSTAFKVTSTGAVDGSFTAPTFQSEVYPGDFAIRPDGRVLIWGNFDTVNTTPRHGMALLNTDGSLDAFNLSGVANLYSVADAVLLDSGQILAATNLGVYSASGTLTKGVSRFNADGTVDGTFTLDAGVNAGSLEPLPDGRLLSWNLNTTALLNASPVLQRLALNGALDGTYTGPSASAFGTVYRNPANSNRITSIVQGYFEIVGHYPDGRALAVATVPNVSYPAGAASLGITVVRINPDGTLDAGFTAPSVSVPTNSGFTPAMTDPLNPGDAAAQFTLTTAGNSPFSGVEPQADGSVIVYGSFASIGGNAAPGIARLTSTGAFDSGFSVGTGPALSTPAGRSPLVQNIKVGPDGKTWITGLFDSFSGVAAHGIVRLNPNGSVDTALATPVAYRSYFGNGTRVGFGSSGEVYLTGTYAQPFEPFPFALHRLVGTVTPAITTHPQSQSVAVGADVTFSVSVTPGLTVAYQWYKGGVAISGATSSTYGLKNVQVADAASYTVVVTNAVNFATSNAAVLSIGGTFDAWQTAKFDVGEQGNPAISGPNAVYGQDGLPNLVKYALGLEPKQNITTGLPVVSSSGGNWVYTYTRPTTITDITYTVQYSTNLTTWTDLTDTTAGTTGGVETRQATFSQTTAPNIFFRLQVALPSPPT